MTRFILVAVCLLAAALSPVHSARAGGRVAALALFKDKAVLEIDGTRRTLRVGESSPEGVVLVRASSKEAEIDRGGERLTLRLDGRIAGSFGAAAQPTIIRLVANAKGHYFVDGKVNGHGVEFVVDTGATLVALSKSAARQIGLPFRVDGKPGQIQTASGIAAAYYLKLDEVAVRTIHLQNVDAVVVDGDYPATALLGQSFLNRIGMRRDGPVMELIGR